ncbi:hypothetical protein G7Z17_g2682 [Cylindrodendrum hubeiense]|uniref:Stc1 domain-containing protein n=1 Tax=Cylindrodendrum hubeiense TaxID=595255 RepID=A0A9P5LKS9_9HYPO|nr:hypothetical protein G7Z17_g2682 [Cylindrodendrum hubeiense]
MAPNQNKGGFRPFRCKVGGEWKPLNAFSANQQKLIQRNIEGKRKIDAAHSGMTCRDHTSKSRCELRCEVCGLIKSKDQFSKNSLKHEEYEPTVTPAPLETGHISIEEENVDVWQHNFDDNADFFEDDGLPQYMVETASVSGESVYTSSTLPPHLARLLRPSATGPKSTSGASEVTQKSRTSSTLPPHLRNSAPQNSSAGSISTATTVRKDKEEREKSRLIPFNAWGPTGIQYQGIKEPTDSSISSATSDKPGSNANIHDDPNVIGEWDSAPVEEPQPRGNGRWPKASESRIPQSELKKQPVLTHTKSRHIDPDIDRQRRMNYCDSDDSDY